MVSWNVVPMSNGQLLDIDPDDLLDNGLFRLCNTYKGGGGYDQFPIIAAETFGGTPDDYHNQFVVQLKGCNLDCPYCYVTRAGVWGKSTKVSTEYLVDAFIASGAQVFHLMGGAPALQLKHWPELVNLLKIKCPNAVFHSDFMLTESPKYNIESLNTLAKTKSLCAINIKGLTSEEWLLNTRKELDETRFWRNWRTIQESSILSYITFTNVSRDNLKVFWDKAQQHGINYNQWKDSYYIIDLIDYKASKHVDDTKWGKSQIHLT